VKVFRVLHIQQLFVTSNNVPILQGIDCVFPSGAVVVLVGENGSGKSSLASTLVGHPAYTIIAGSIIWNNENIVTMSIQERSLKGLFMTFQQQPVLEGVVVFDFLSEVTRLHALCMVDDIRCSPTFDMYGYILSIAHTVGISPEMLIRTFDSGFSSGELRRIELMMYLIIKPQITIFDEIDAGLDCGAVDILIRCIKQHRHELPNAIHVIITHTISFARSLNPDVVYLLQKGSIVAKGKSDLLDRIELQGYRAI